MIGDVNGMDSVMENGEVISEQCMVNDKIRINTYVDGNQHDTNGKIVGDKDEKNHSEVCDLNDSYANIFVAVSDASDDSGDWLETGDEWDVDFSDNDGHGSMCEDDNDGGAAARQSNGQSVASDAIIAISSGDEYDWEYHSYARIHDIFVLRYNGNPIP